MQALRAPLPAGELEFPGQCVQDDAPSLEYLPVGQVLHDESPALECLPAAHSVQAAADVDEYWPAWQVLHDELPLMALNLPTPQLKHVSPSLPVNPASHVQLLSVMLPTCELEFAGQAMQEELPIVSLYFPAAQCWQEP